MSEVKTPKQKATLRIDGPQFVAISGDTEIANIVLDLSAWQLPDRKETVECVVYGIYQKASANQSGAAAGLGLEGRYALVIPDMQRMASQGSLANEEREKTTRYVDNDFLVCLEQVMKISKDSAKASWDKAMAGLNTKAEVQAKVVEILGRQPKLKAAYDKRVAGAEEVEATAVDL